jgi:hypothetical protein
MHEASNARQIRLFVQMMLRFFETRKMIFERAFITIEMRGGNIGIRRKLEENRS